MKIAAITNDGSTVGLHFGQASGYVVYTVEGGEVVAREHRAKPSCHHPEGHEHAQDEAHEHGRRDLHSEMTGVISDCAAVIARRIPPPMVRHLVAIGINPLITDIASIEDAVNAYLAASADDTPVPRDE
jgi:predicted Fe-Mo cluster-binding NifX family protein